MHEYDWCLNLFLVMFVIVFCGRFMVTIGFIKIIDLCGYNSGISLKELVFIGYAGMIRGAVAFGLVLRIEDTVDDRGVIVTTALCLVAATTIIMGSTVSTLKKFMFGSEHAEPVE